MAPTAPRSPAPRHKLVPRLERRAALHIARTKLEAHDPLDCLMRVDFVGMAVIEKLSDANSTMPFQECTLGCRSMCHSI